MHEFSLLYTLITIVVIMGVLQGSCAYLIWVERKLAAYVQDRIGPNRVGPFGLLQPIADGLKFLLKEEVIPDHVDKLFYLLAPAIALITALMAFAVVPFGPTSPPPTLLDYRQTLTDPNAAPQPVWPGTQSEMNEVLAADRQYAEQTGGKSYEEQVQDYNESIQFVIAPHVDIGLVFVFAIGSLAVYAVVLG